MPWICGRVNGSGRLPATHGSGGPSWRQVTDQQLWALNAPIRECAGTAHIERA
jgi:hypothetical protein